MNSLDTINLKDIAEAIAAVSDVQAPPVAPPSMTEEEAHARRMARLPDWAKDHLARAEARADAADRRLADAFGEPDPEDAEQIVVDDYHSPLRGKAVPTKQLAFPAHGIRVMADRHGRGVEVHGLDLGMLSVRPQSGNSIIVRVTRD